MQILFSWLRSATSNRLSSRRTRSLDSLRLNPGASPPVGDLELVSFSSNKGFRLAIRLCISHGNDIGNITAGDFEIALPLRVVRVMGGKFFGDA